MENEYFSSEEMAKKFSISKITLYSWYNKGEKKDLPPVIKIGGKWFFPIAGYEAWKAKQLSKSKTIAEFSADKYDN